MTADHVLYRCDGCGNRTRFDVTARRTTKSFHHYTIAGELTVESVDVLNDETIEVACRWCGHGRAVVAAEDDAPANASPDAADE